MPSPDEVHAAARIGTSGAAGKLPYLAQIQRSFGRHNVGGVKAHFDAKAVEGAQAMGATAFTTGNHVAFGKEPSLHTAAHEAAHVVQQQAGVQLLGGVGEVGDRYEQHADAVADQVVAGRSSEKLLDAFAPPAQKVSHAAPADNTQCQVVQREDDEDEEDTGPGADSPEKAELADDPYYYRKGRIITKKIQMPSSTCSVPTRMT